MKNKITAIILAFVLISVAYGATRSLVPRADSEGGLGTSSKWWLEAYIDTVYTEVLDVNGTTTIGTLTLADGSITDSGGAISFGNENLSTTGTGTFGFNGIKLLDEDTGYYINLRVEDDTTTGQDRLLEFDVGNASRILNITGDPTLADWFDQSVKVAAGPTFASVITNLLDTTGAADMDYGSADVTDHTFIADGGTAIIDGSFQFPDADGSPSAVGELQYDNTVANWDDGALCWYDDDEVKYLVDLATLPTNDDYVVAYDAAIDKFYMKADADTGGATAYDDIGDPDAASSITFADGETVTWATTEDSAGSFFTIDDSDAALAANTYLMHLLYSVDDDEANADYFKCEDAGGVVLSIQQNGDLASTGIVDLNPAHIATATIVDITPSAVISTNEAVWNAVIVDGAALDPSGDDVLVCGIGIDFSGVVPSGSGGDMDGIQVQMADGEKHAIHIEEGKVIIDNTAGSAVGAEYTVVDIRLNTTNLNTNSDIHAIDVAVEAGTPAGKVVALGTHTNVNPIAQSIGTFSTPNQTEYAGERHTGGTVWADGVDGSEIFIADDDAVYVGSAAVFNEIEVDMATAATKNVTPTFHYNTAADTWTEFFPADDTDGFQQDGTVRWDLDDISGSWTSDGDPCGTDTSTGYWIKVVRTANADPGTPTPTTIKTGVITSYSWDKTGAIDVLSVEGDTITEGGDAVYSSSETPGGELGGTFASFTIDDSVAVSNWNLTTPTFTTTALLAGILQDNDDMVFEADADNDGSNKFSFTDGAAAEIFSITEAGVVAASSTITAVGSFIIGAADMAEADLEKLDGITNGTAAANKALVLGASGEIATITTATITTATITNNIKGEPKHIIFNIINPLATQTEDNEICLWPAVPAALTVTKIQVTLDASGNEVAGDLKWADAFIGLAGATVINVFDTSSGVLVDATITAGSVASGKCIYIAFDSAPNTAIKQMCVDITYDYD